MHLTFALWNTNTETESSTTENASVGGAGVDRSKRWRKKQCTRLDKNEMANKLLHDIEIHKGRGEKSPFV